MLPASRKILMLAWLSVYVVLMIAIVGAMLWQRQQTLAIMSTSAARAEWDTWREDVIQQQSHPGPVQRRVPKSHEPPALVLMRDYFVVSLAAATFFTSLLYWIVAWMVTGAIVSASDPHRLSQVLAPIVTES